MRRDHGPAGLTAPLLASGVAGAAALGGWLAPQIAQAPHPLLGDTLAGWALLAAGAGATWRGRVRAGLLLLSAGLVWILVGLAGLLPPALEGPVLRLGLLPTALVVLAALLRVRPAWSQPVDGARSWALAVVLLPPVVAALGYDRWAIAATGVAGGTALWLTLRHRGAGAGRQRDASVTAAAVAGSVALAGLVTAGVGGVAASTASTVLEAVLGLAGLVVAAGRDHGAWRPVQPVQAAHGLEDALARTLGWSQVLVAFPLGSAFVDAGGTLTAPPTDGEEVLDRDGRLVAVLAPGLGRDTGVADSVREVLRLAGQGALLQAELRVRADELAASRERLVRAAEAERERFVASLGRGPVARMDTVVVALERCHRAGSASSEVTAGLAERAVVARDELLRVAQGVDPVGTASLQDALNGLIARSGTGARFDCRLPDGWRPRASVSRAAWFTCAEALTNATKHAPGAVVDISVTLSGDQLILVVRDDGPGGVDVGGHGLGGLVERATALGGTLTARSQAGGGGSELVLRLPVGSTGVPAALDGRAPDGRAPDGEDLATADRAPWIGRVVVRVPTTLALLGLCAALVLSACAGPPARTGRSADPVSLRTMYGNGPGGVGADVLEELVRASSGSSVVLGTATQLSSAPESDDERATRSQPCGPGGPTSA